MIPRPSRGEDDAFRSGPARGYGSGGGRLAETALLSPEMPGAPGTDVGRPVEWARVPRVNLLPPEVIEARRFRLTRKILVGVVLGVVLLCGVGTLWAQQQVGSARSALEITRSHTVALQRQQAQYAEVPKVSAELDAARVSREQAMSSDVLWYRFLTDLAVNTPDGATLSSVTITMTGSTAGPAATGLRPTGLRPTGLGTVKVSGDAGRYSDVAAWLDASARVNGLTGTTLQSAVRGDTGGGPGKKVTYSGGAVISPAALSHRYDRKAN